jgi:uncharacterized membrane protein
MSGDHHHGHEPGAAAVRRWLSISVAVVAALTLAAVVWLWPRGDAPELNPGGVVPEYVDGTVTDVRTEECASFEIAGATVECQIVEVDVTSGATAGLPASFQIQATDFSKPRLDVGDEIVMLRNAQAPPELQYTYVDQQRSAPLLLLTVLFVVAVVALGRWKGVRALAGVAVGLAVIIVFLLPSLLRGNPALPVALAGTVLIAFLALYLAHGVNPATTVALVGTLVSLVVIAVLAQVFIALADLTGLTGGEAQTLRVTAEAIDLRALLVAGTVIGALGVLDDVTVTQVSTVVELRRLDREMPAFDLYRRAVRVGRDHIASTVNTLVLAYAGASLPLLLVFLQTDRPWERALTGELVAIEIVRTLVGSIGLVLAVPVTTGLAAVALTAAPEEPVDTFDDV